MKRDQRRDRRVDDGFGDRVAVERDRVGEHVRADVAREQEAAPVQDEFAAAQRAVAPIRVQTPHEPASALLESGRERAGHESEPVAVHGDLFLDVDRGDRVLEVLDRRHRRFQHDVADTGRIVAADRMRAVDMDFDMQAVVDEQQRRGRLGLAAVSDERVGAAQGRGGPVRLQYLESLGTDAVALRLAVCTGAQRKIIVEEAAHVVDHERAALRVVF